VVAAEILSVIPSRRNAWQYSGPKKEGDDNASPEVTAMFPGAKIIANQKIGNRRQCLLRQNLLGWLSDDACTV